MRNRTYRQHYREIPSPLQAIWDVLGGTAPIARSGFRTVPRVALFLSLTLALLPVGLAAYPFGARRVRPVSMLWFKGVNRICNLKIRVHGQPAQGRSVLYVGNHVSYLDIPVLGETMDGSFIAKQEVAGWPLFGLCAKIVRTVFVKRDPKEAMVQKAEIGERLEAGERLILFPEGTSTDGKRVLPFKSALFSVAQPVEGIDEPMVQPFSISYPRYADGQPLDQGNQSLYAWHGEAELFPHLMSVFGLRGAIVDVTFHEPVRASDFNNRKELAVHCHGQVAHGVNRSHAQRLYKPEPVGGELGWTV